MMTRTLSFVEAVDGGTPIRSLKLFAIVDFELYLQRIVILDDDIKDLWLSFVFVLGLEGGGQCG